MKFEKRLVILSGENNAKGTVTLECNAYGTFATFNVYNIPDLLSGEYAVGIKNADGIFTRKLGSMGRILSRFKISDISLSGVHCVIYDTATETPVLYGCTPDTPRLWAGNMMDGIRSRKVEFTKETTQADIEKALPSYSERPNENEISDYFLDILPADGNYRDTAVAQVNYYPTDMSIEVAYSDRASSGYVPEENPVDKHVREQTESDGAQKDGDRLMPWQYAKLYINRYKDYAAASGRHKNIGASANENMRKLSVSEIGAAESPEGPEEQPKEAMPEEKNFSLKNMPKENPAKVLSDGNEEAAATVVPPASEYTAESALRDKKTESVFYERIKSQLDELFSSNPEFGVLGELMPDTKWIKVDYDESGKYYVVGLIGRNPDYICYGVPAKYSPTPPDELDGYCAWLPIKSEEPQGEGFWIMYQDAVTGESVKR